jgi:hypothetical protein
MTSSLPPDSRSAAAPRRPCVAWAQKLGLLVLSIALSLGIAELFLRSRSSLELGYEYRNGAFRGPREFVTDKARNSLGYHDWEPGPRVPGVRRILLVGDSYVAATFVSIPETVGKRLEAHLEAEGSERVQVVSIGGPAWGQRQQLSALREHAPALQPDLILTLFLPFNDIRDNLDRLARIANQEVMGMKRFRPGWSHIPKQEAPLFWFEGSAINRLLSYRLAIHLSSRGDDAIPLDYLVYSAYYDRDWELAWKATQKLLRSTASLAQEFRADYGIVSASTPHGVYGAEEGLERLLDAYPAMRDRSWDLDGPNRRLEEFCDGERIPVLSLEPLFRRHLREHGEPLHWRYDGHWNPRGNDLAARYIAEFILSQYSM